MNNKFANIGILITRNVLMTQTHFSHAEVSNA